MITSIECLLTTLYRQQTAEGHDVAYFLTG
jgi:hypothetical protein